MDGRRGVPATIQIRYQKERKRSDDVKEVKFDMEQSVRRAAGGNREAWDALYRATVQEGYFLALKLVGNQDDAMDLVHDAYTAALEKLNQLEEPEKFQAWFNTIVANKCRNFLRKKKLALFSEMENEDGDVPEWEDDREGLRPDAVMDKAEATRLIAEIVDGLPEDQLACVNMYYRNEMSIGQIAAALEISEGTIKSRLNYARKKIKTKVEELEKQGVKLYGFAPIPYFIWLLKNSTDSYATAGVSVAAEGATTGVSGGAVVSNSAVAAASGSKMAASTVVLKILAGTVATVVAVSGAILYATKQEPSLLPAEGTTIQTEMTVMEEHREESLPTAACEANILGQTLDFSKAWAFMLPTADGTYVDPFEDPEVPYFGIAMISFGFSEAGDVRLLYYETYSDVFMGSIGTYSVSDEIIEFSLNGSGEEYRYTYRFDAENLTLTQLSSEGIGHTKENVHQLIEDPFHDRNSLYDSVDAYFYLQEHPNAYDG